jgi:hypothetical protein
MGSFGEAIQEVRLNGARRLARIEWLAVLGFGGGWRPEMGSFGEAIRAVGLVQYWVALSFGGRRFRKAG